MLFAEQLDEASHRALATVLRALAGTGAMETRTMLLAASLCWSVAFALLLVLLLRVDASRWSGHRPE